MSHRQFKSCSVFYGDKMVSGIEIACGKCSAIGRFPRGSYKGKFVPPGSAEDAQFCTNIFNRNDWFVGKRPQEDRCPDCAAALGIERKRPAEPKNPVMEAKLKEAIATHDAAKSPQEQPREMNREEGRIIFAKLEEVYRDEKHGYQNGWSGQTYVR